VFIYSQQIREKRILMRRLLLILFLTLTGQQFIFAQFFGQIPEEKKYKASQVIDPDYGIKMYEKLNFQIGGDSVRNDKRGYACQGWVQDLYESGTILHKGYYEDGHLKVYKNFFENGNVERSFKVIDFKKSNEQIFYSDGKLKADITFYEGNPQMETDYYPNGQIEYLEENTKNMEYLIQRKSYAEDGKPQELFEMTDPKKKIYSKKEYHENGNIKSEGPMKYNPAAIDYQKDGAWKNYDESGKLVSQENWVNGEERK
jgi:antitoxin component YwqK of YwqJK toxin-antitoxin module